jgi:hypothetical protein
MFAQFKELQNRWKAPTAEDTAQAQAILAEIRDRVGRRALD